MVLRYFMVWLFYKCVEIKVDQSNVCTLNLDIGRGAEFFRSHITKYQGTLRCDLKCTDVTLMFSKSGFLLKVC